MFLLYLGGSDFILHCMYSTLNISWYSEQVVVRRKTWRVGVWFCSAWCSKYLWPSALFFFQFPFWCLRGWCNSAYFLVLLCNFFLILVYRYEIPFASQLGLFKLFGRNQSFFFYWILACLFESALSSYCSTICSSSCMRGEMVVTSFTWIGRGFGVFPAYFLLLLVIIFQQRCGDWRWELNGASIHFS
jgi:hypothetical protein